jgi:hypothetical protein
MSRRSSSCFWFLFVAFAVALGAPPVAAPPAKAKAKAGPEVIVVADVMPNPPAELVPAPGKPVHYVIVGMAERTLGAAIAGEPQPDKAMLQREVEKALASQGFVRTQLGGPIPTLALIVTWGSANLMMDDFTETDPATGAESTSTVVYNRREIAQLVGADKANRRMVSSSDADAINDAARQDRLYLFIGAFDALALAKKQKKLLWRTAMSIESRRTSLPESLPIMLASAAPWFGRDTELPVFVDDAVRRKAEVHIGAPVVVPDVKPPNVPDAKTPASPNEKKK